MDPAEDIAAKLGAPSFEKTFETFIKEHAQKRCKPSSLAAYEWLLKKSINPALGHKKTIEISQADIETFHSSLSETKYNTNRCLGLLRTIFNKAED
ncbi:hypothetical protein ACMG4P_21715 [Pseudovibrio denitrificans]|uniref:hypothetical protein n=1 Tax=Pseudovibrio denitrificans TaxID=258256 RepID=UPI0039BF2150